LNKIAILILSILMFAQVSCAASFDCSKAGTKVEKMICADPELSKLDEDLSAAYKKALKESSDPATLKQQQRDWMKERNKCTDAQCVKHAYNQRLSSLSNSSASMAGGMGAKHDVKNGRYHFQLTKGKGTSVCDAYLKRLNTTEFTSPPYCGRPENDSVKGFTKLNRVPLSPKDVQNLYPIIWDYLSMRNRHDISWWADNANQQRIDETSRFHQSDDAVKSLQIYWNNDWAKVWHYVSPIDIDNDDKQDQVEIWYGVAARGQGGTLCGESPFVHPDAPPVRLPQIAFVVSNDGNRLDVVKTEKVFAHPSGGYHFYSPYEKKWVVSDKFRPVGKSVGIFKYKGTYYFDTFFDEWGDFEDKRYGWDDPVNKRLAETGKGKSYDKNITNTLAVFLHKDGKTRQVCEYLMTDNETQEGGRGK